MPLHLFDTLTRTVKPLVPCDGATYRFYCCGPTVYGPAHIGNFRTFIMQDVFRRVMEGDGVATKHVRNITDVDDKTIRQSQAEGVSLGEFTACWTERFHVDSEALNILLPHIEQSAVEAIPSQIELIEELVKKKNAYVADDGSVYFDVSSFDDYGCLSRLKEREITTVDANRGNGSGGVALQSDDEYDRDSAADFALWKARRPEDGDNYWQSPWGEGRPGWHIECSAMSLQHLGESFDLHGGGIDLVFPHHENEIAQCEAATGCRFTHHWFHVAHLMVEGAKMSKSLGNLYTVADVEERGFTANELRYVLISGNYRQPLNYTWDSLAAAHQALRRITKLHTKLTELSGGLDPEPNPTLGSFLPAWEALLADLNTPEALGRTFSAAKEIERRIASGALDSSEATTELGGLHGILHALGIKPEEEVKNEVTIPDEIAVLAEKRWEAKQSRDWAASDALRDELLTAGWTVKDGKDGYELEKG